jgi:5-methylcytosine-specific restriction endonuclease McrA
LEGFVSVRECPECKQPMKATPRQMRNDRGYLCNTRRWQCLPCEAKRQRRVRDRRYDRSPRWKADERKAQHVREYWWRMLGRGYGLACRKPKPKLERKPSPIPTEVRAMGSAEVYRWKYRNDEAFRTKEIARRHARKVMKDDGPNDGTLTPSVVGGLFARAKQCAYCYTPMSPRDKTLDHIIPRSRGGMHGVGNVVVCCRSCNSRKHARTPTEWRAA